MQFPGTNLQDLNLDWIVDKVRQLEQQVDTIHFVYYIEYGHTGYDTVKDAIDSGKNVQVTYLGHFYHLTDIVFIGDDTWGVYTGYTFTSIDTNGPKLLIATCRKYTDGRTRWANETHNI